MFAKEGLQGVVAARTGLSRIDGEKGYLGYRGYSISDVARNACFEEAVHLLWNGELPNRMQLDETRRSLASQRLLPPAIVDLVSRNARDAAPMDLIRTAVSAMAIGDPDLHESTREANLRKGARLTAMLPTAVALHERARKGLEPVRPDPELGHAANFLWMLHGRRPGDLEARALDVAMILQLDHGLNASTFAARVTAGTMADLHAAITSAIGTLKGPLHGGANHDVMVLLKTIGEVGKAAEHVRALLAQKKKIPGFGHRVYRTLDPRAIHLRELSAALAKSTGNETWYEMSTVIEKTCKEVKNLNANVDFYAASTYSMLGFEMDQFTPIFACSRLPGWIAHVIEQHLDNRLIRPLEEYIGPPDRAWVGLAERP
ncbi:MAG TPA: citrate/2-methylcitrate synthase [Candidatus Polarisedimenticolia bacterium]|nr:citrate/2-methylcitrate synthase [Candidatus Polarisedimenticolia bacterium]